MHDSRKNRPEKNARPIIHIGRAVEGGKPMKAAGLESHGSSHFYKARPTVNSAGQALLLLLS